MLDQYCYSEFIYLVTVLRLINHYSRLCCIKKNNKQIEQVHVFALLVFADIDRCDSLFKVKAKVNVLL